MKIPERFQKKEGRIAGDKVFLVTPEHVAPSWDENNSKFRSSIWNEAGELVSAGFRKFTNVGEQPLFEPLDFSKPLTFVEKLDGSCLIVSKYKDELIVRTRGTFDARNLENGHEIDELIKKFPRAFDNGLLNNGFSLLFEWVTPRNQIVLNYSELDLYLIGVVDHADYSYVQQDKLDHLASLWGVKRPRYYDFSDFELALQEVDGWTNSEGVVVYSECGQIVKKIKSEWYRQQHYFRTGGSTPNKIADMWLAVGEPTNAQLFFDAVESFHDFETATFLAKEIKSAGDLVEKIHKLYKESGEGLKKHPEDRKTRALWIQSHKSDLFKKVAFMNLSNRELEKGFIHKSIREHLKNESK